jgi:hypothetical protein
VQLDGFGNGKRLLWIGGRDHSIAMRSNTAVQSDQKKKRSGRGYTYREPASGLPGHQPAGVHESYSGGSGRIETMLSDIVTRLERIEEKIDENVYPPESAIKPEFIRRVKKAQADIAAGKGKTYDSMDAFIRALNE